MLLNIPTIQRTPVRHHVMATALACAFVVLPAAETWAAIRYVNANLGSGSNNGTSWANAYRGTTALQSALTAAVAGDEIWVVQATYRPSLDAFSGFPRSKTFKLKSGVGLYGGFAGTETQQSQRNFVTNVTILSGDLSSNDGSNFSNYGDNAYHVVVSDGTNASTVMDGFTIRGGSADDGEFDGNPGSHRFERGGGLYNGPQYSGGTAGNPTVRNCIFTLNQTTNGNGGGAVKNDGGTPKFVYCTFVNNRAFASGSNCNGGAFAGSNAQFVNCSFLGNQAQSAGGAINCEGSVVMTSCLFSGNTANHQCSNGAGVGGGVYASGSNNTVINCTFAGNRALVGDSGCFEQNDTNGGGLYYLGTSVSTLANTVFWGNTRQLHIAQTHVSDQAGQVYRTSGAPAGNYCTVQGLNTMTGTGNISSDPLFVDANGSDNVFGTIDDNARLQITSPSIDNASNTLVPTDALDADLDGNTAEPLPLDRDGYRRFEDIPTVTNGGVGTPPIADRGAYERQNDCNNNGIPDYVEGLADCNTNSTADVCESFYTDCNTNVTMDRCELTGRDCNTNLTLDICEAIYRDCNTNNTMDRCEAGYADCNTNNTFDQCETSIYADCNTNSTMDRCETAIYADCNTNNTMDRCEINITLSHADCNTNNVPDLCDLSGGALDCNDNRILDVCEMQTNSIFRSGSALDFPGNTPYVNVAAFGGVAPTTEITIEFWQRATALQSQSTIELVPNVNTNRINVHAPWNDGTIYWDFGNINTNGRLAYTPPQSIVGKWTHFAFVASQTNNHMRIYRNGVLEAQRVGMTPFVLDGTKSLRLGSIQGGNNYDGQIDEVRVWSVARTSTQIRNNMFTTVSGGAANLVGYWRLNDGSGQTASNQVNGGTNGTLEGNPAPQWLLQRDCNTNNRPDLCELGNDCNTNNIPDSCDVADGAADCNTDVVPDICQADSDLNTNGIPDLCEPDAYAIGSILPIPPNLTGNVPSNAQVFRTFPSETLDPTMAFFHAVEQQWFANPPILPPNGNGVVRIKWRNASNVVLRVSDYLIADYPATMSPYVVTGTNYYFDWFRDLQNAVAGFSADIPLRTAPNAPTYPLSFRYNSIIQDRSNPTPDDVHLDGSGNFVHVEPTCAAGKIIVQYDEFTNGPLVGFEVLSLRNYGQADLNDSPIGRRLVPPMAADNSRAVLHRNATVTVGGSQYGRAWQRGQGTGAPTVDIFPIRPDTSTANATNLVVSWWHANPFGNSWPVAMTRHTCNWPTDLQLHAIDLAAGGNQPVGSLVPIPANLYCGTAIMYQATFANAQRTSANITGGIFSASTEGYTVVRFDTQPAEGACGDNVRMEVIASYDHANAAVLAANNADVPWPVGMQLTDGGHDAATPQPFKYGYLYSGQPYATGVYPFNGGAPTIGTGQIFPVNVRNGATGQNAHGQLEAWWYQQKLTNVSGVFWPFKVVKYSPAWPNAPQKIVIAGRNGSGPTAGTAYPAHPDTSIYHVGNYATRLADRTTVAGWNPNDEHAILLPVGGGLHAFASRDDDSWGLAPAESPYVIVKYRDPDNATLWRFGVNQVVAVDLTNGTGADDDFDYNSFALPDGGSQLVVAGQALDPLYPVNFAAPPCLSGNPPVPQTTIVPISGEALWVDRQGTMWAMEGQDDQGNTHMVGANAAGQINLYENWSQNGDTGCRPWHSVYSGATTPTPIIFRPSWPSVPPACPYPADPLCARPLQVGQTVNVSGFCGNVTVLHNSVNGMKILDPTYEVSVNAMLPGDADFAQLPPQLYSGEFNASPLPNRVRYVLGNPGTLYFTGIMANRDRDFLKKLSQNGNNGTWNTAIDSLYNLSRAQLTTPLVNPAQKYISVGNQQTHPGWLTLAFQNDIACAPTGSPSVEVWNIDCPPFSGAINVITPQCVFNEKNVLQFSGDCGGDPDSLYFHWQYSTVGAQGPWSDYIPPAGYTDGRGLREVVIEGASPFTLANSYWRVRYRGYFGCQTLDEDGPDNVAWPASFGGVGTAISAFTPGQLAEGWIIRVVRGLNPFDQRIRDFHNNATATYVNMIQQAGIRYEAPVALNCDPNNLNAIGLIQAYETVIRRARLFSIDAGIDYQPANDAILNAASRVSDLHVLLANEAYADAADPTIGLYGGAGGYGSNDPHAMFCFQNQVATILEEELALLRGRDSIRLPSADSDINGNILATVYNRIPWNFTSGAGQVAYANNYQVTSLPDARTLYPQGHGDAWGHYLTSVKKFYDLLRHPLFRWTVHTEDVLVGNGIVQVGYEYERKFAKAAAAKARTGAALTNLTFRQRYDSDPSDQDGYPDANTARAWGVSEWGRRSGQGAYIDWICGASLLDDNDTVHQEGSVDKIDRNTVTEIGEVAAAFSEIQSVLDQADAGLNPLGLATNVVPFGLNPNEIDAGSTHFDQIAGRTLTALNNAVTAFDFANQNTQRLREAQDQSSEFAGLVDDTERDFKARLIEYFGRPYPEDIGPGATYPTGYDGPDIYHYEYADPSNLAGTPSGGNATTISVTFSERSFTRDGNGNFDGGFTDANRTVSYNVSSDGLGLIKPEGWTSRPEPGEIQLARSEVLTAIGSYLQAQAGYEQLVAEIEGQTTLLTNVYNISQESIEIQNSTLNTIKSLNEEIYDLNNTVLAFRRLGEFTQSMGEALQEFLPASVGLSNDVTSTARGAILVIGATTANAVFGTIADIAEGQKVLKELDKEEATFNAQTQIFVNDSRIAVQEQIAAVLSLVREAPVRRLEIYTLEEGILSAGGRYLKAVGEATRILEQRDAFRRNAGSQVASYRYRDMAFRVFRNDALQKYRAQFDLAARYVYLAAKAYDYETNLLGTDSQSGRSFLQGIVKERSLGIVTNGVPQVGNGLAGQLALLQANFNVLRSSLGFNSPTELQRTFSLRWENFRVPNLAANDGDWRNTLNSCRVDNVNALQEYRLHCQPLQGAPAVNPGVVIPFTTTIQSGLNLFGHPSTGDATLPSDRFAIKLHSFSVRFVDYPGAPLNLQTNVYLVPIGSDMMRVPLCPVAPIREWRLLDQTLPVPFPLTNGNLQSTDWQPWDGLSGGAAALVARRLIPTSGACEFADPECSDISYKLTGRSIWNSRWVLIIPGSELQGSNPSNGVNVLINGLSGNDGISDIKLVTRSYGYSGCGGPAPIIAPPDDGDVQATVEDAPPQSADVGG